MNDKLAEAIAKYDSGDLCNTGGQWNDIAWEAAKAYHDLPAVDVDGLKRAEVFPEEYVPVAHIRGWNDCLDRLRTIYPNGLKWG